MHELDAKLLCPNCHQSVEADYVVCPNCHHQLKLRCVGCGHLVMPNWDVCPYCGRFQHEDDVEAQAAPVEPAVVIEALDVPAEADESMPTADEGAA